MGLGAWGVVLRVEGTVAMRACRLTCMLPACGALGAMQKMVYLNVKSQVDMDNADNVFYFIEDHGKPPLPDKQPRVRRTAATTVATTVATGIFLLLVQKQKLCRAKPIACLCLRACVPASLSLPFSPCLSLSLLVWACISWFTTPC